MRILLTGATGFVGSSILSKLIHEKDLELNTMSRSKPIKKAWQSKVKHYICDFDSHGIRALLEKRKYELLVHAAWQGLPNRSPEVNALNVHFSSTLFEEFVNSGGKVIIGIGSCLEYGERTGQVSELDKGHNLSDFGVIKRSLLDQVSNFGIPYLWLRPFYLYGANQHSYSLLNLALKHLSNEESTWLREPFAANDFTSVEDLGSLIQRAINGKLWLGELNVGTSYCTQNIEFVNLIRTLKGKSAYKIPVNECKGMSADLTKLRESLVDFTFSRLDEGLSSVFSEMGQDRN